MAPWNASEDTPPAIARARSAFGSDSSAFTASSSVLPWLRLTNACTSLSAASAIGNLDGAASTCRIRLFWNRVSMSLRPPKKTEIFFEIWKTSAMPELAALLGRFVSVQSVHR